MTADKAYSLYQQGRYDDACVVCDEVLAKSSNELALQVKALSSHKLGRTEQALALIKEAVQLQPKEAQRCYSYALMLLYAGDFTQGWRHYERRTEIKSFGIPVLPQVPSWHGQDLHQKTILVVCEQGFGDCIMFARYLPLLKQRGAKIMVACFPPLIKMFEAEPSVDEIITKYDMSPGRFDYAVLICSLAGVFAANLDNIPTPAMFHRPSEEKLGRWTSRLPESGLRIGIAWSGRAKNEDDINRSATLEDFLSLRTNRDMTLVSLQKHHPLPGQTGFCQLGAEIADFSDLAAIIVQLDWVICVDTAVAHLAASMGKETWVILPSVPDWRWHSDTDGSPWYPSVRLFRQNDPGNWSDVFEQIDQAINDARPSDP